MSSTEATSTSLTFCACDVTTFVSPPEAKSEGMQYNKQSIDNRLSALSEWGWWRDYGGGGTGQAASDGVASAGRVTRSVQTGSAPKP